MIEMNYPNSPLKLQQPINQRMGARKTALNRRCKAKIGILSSKELNSQRALRAESSKLGSLIPIRRFVD